MKLIDADALIREMEKRKEYHEDHDGCTDRGIAAAYELAIAMVKVAPEVKNEAIETGNEAIDLPDAPEWPDANEPFDRWE